MWPTILVSPRSEISQFRANIIHIKEGQKIKNVSYILSLVLFLLKIMK